MRTRARLGARLQCTNPLFCPCAAAGLLAGCQAGSGKDIWGETTLTNYPPGLGVPPLPAATSARRCLSAACLAASLPCLPSFFLQEPQRVDVGQHSHTHALITATPQGGAAWRCRCRQTTMARRRPSRSSASAAMPTRAMPTPGRCADDVIAQCQLCGLGGMLPA